MGRLAHVGREHEMRVRQRPDDGRLDPLVLGDRRGEPGGIELGDLAVVALAECGRVGLGLRDVRVDARVVDALVEIREVPRDLFRPGHLGRRHAPQSSDGAPRAA